MAEPVVPLSILDLSPVSEGSTVGAALRNTIDLARRAEAVGYRRYWVAELWVRSIRSGAGAMRFPSPATVAAFDWSPEDRALVEDRVSTQFTGSPETVAKHLRVLQEATGADEVLVTAITHQHADRVRSFELLARKWGLRG
jgi:alkanesulfonate monooxygenase SsuD/methylene tetrahydromethanopterin reductase-like flavin-dependent oxidoreductase (luciferase family)